MKKLPVTILDLLHFRWSVPVLAAFSDVGNAGKFVTIQRRLGVTRGSLQRTLAFLIDAELVERNQGYGHPLRPEYRLTKVGGQCGLACARLLSELQSPKLREVALKKWSLPVLVALESTGRFNRTQEQIEGISPRALSLTLRELQQASLIERHLVDSSPPRADYALTKMGNRLARLTLKLAKAA